MPTRTFTGAANTTRHTELDTPLPPPDRRSRIVARVLLWTLLGFAVVRGVLPLPSPQAQSHTIGPGRTSVGSPSARPVQDEAATATAAAFLREYLTVDDSPERPGRLGRYLARGVDVGDGVLPERGISQTVDLEAPAGVRRLEGGGLEVTVLAHLVHTRDGTDEDGGTVAFAVPVIGAAHGVAVAGIPRPVALPIDPATTSRPAALPGALARSVAAVAGQAVAAVLNGDRPALARLGGGAAPVVRPFPSGWRPLGITEIRPTGPAATPTAQVLVRARPPTSGIEYLVPVRVALRLAATTPIVREVDAGGTS